MKIKYIKLALLAIIGIFIINACGSSKKGKEISKTKMFYHNLTSKYNGYFNANELMIESELKLSDLHQDNYNQLLDVYSFVEVENPKVVATDLDKAVEKVATVASLHRPSHWLDDCYVLMGKAQYLKHDYETAEQTLAYFAEEFDPKNPFGSNFKNNKKSKKQKKKEKAKEQKKKRAEKKKAQEEKRKARAKKKKNRKKGKRLTKKQKAAIAAQEKLDKENAEKKAIAAKTVEEETAKKKEEQKAKKPGLFKHKPVYNEGLLWLARTYISRQNWSTAAATLKKIENSEYYKPKKLEKEVAVTWADYYLKQKKYDKAIPALELAIAKASKKRNKARYMYILAQIFDQNKQYSQARKYYADVKSLHPAYEMEFNAELNMHKTDLLSGTKSESEVVSKLEKMIKEDKNLEYNDQLYYTLGKLELRKPNISKAIEYFKKSLSSQSNNTAQKAETYYVLADHYYTVEQYYNASMYYDSTLSTMLKKDERYSLVSKYAKNLKSIGNNIKTIRLQDSLLTIANYSEEDLRAYAIILLEKEKELKKNSKTPSSKKFNGTRRNQNTTSRFGSIPSNFFAYNPQLVEAGKVAFQKKWGQRNLENNWRRSSKFEVESEDEKDNNNQEYDDEMSDAELKRILKDIPLTVGAKQKANKKIETALFELGKQYREKLDNCNKSTTALVRLLDDYPKTEHRAEAAYLIYICNIGSNGVLANQYASILKSEFPDSKYTKFITDPNFLRDYVSGSAKVARYYDATYALFSANDYAGTINNVSKVDSLFGKENKYKAKFDLINAMSLGKTESKEAYVKALKTVVTKYPNTPEKTRAQEILRFLKGDKYAFEDGFTSEEIEKFTIQNNRMHYVVVKVHEEKGKFKMENVKRSISDFHKQYYKLDKLKIKESYLDIQSKTSLILIRRFANKEKAMDYHNTVLKNKQDFLDSNIDFEIYAITQHNYREVLKQKKMDIYKQFFKENYIE